MQAGRNWPVIYLNLIEDNLSSFFLAGLLTLLSMSRPRIPFYIKLHGNFSTGNLIFLLVAPNPGEKNTLLFRIQIRAGGFLEYFIFP